MSFGHICSSTIIFVMIRLGFTIFDFPQSEDGVQDAQFWSNIFCYEPGTKKGLNSSYMFVRSLKNGSYCSFVEIINPTRTSFYNLKIRTITNVHEQYRKPNCESTSNICAFFDVIEGFYTKPGRIPPHQTISILFHLY